MHQFVLDAAEICLALGPTTSLVDVSIGGMAALGAVAGVATDAAVLVLVDVGPRVERPGVERIMRFMSAHRNGFESPDQAAEAIAAFTPDRQGRRVGNVGLEKVLRTHPDGRFRWHWDPALVESLAAATGVEDSITDEASETLAAERGALLAQVAIPMLLIRGGSSDVLSPEGAAEVLALAPHAEYADLSDAGHMVAGDRNDAFGVILVEFLRRKILGAPATADGGP